MEIQYETEHLVVKFAISLLPVSCISQLIKEHHRTEPSNTVWICKHLPFPKDLEAKKLFAGKSPKNNIK